MPKTSDQHDPVIAFNQVSKTFKLRHARSLKQTLTSALKGRPIADSFNALDNVSFEVRPGESVAVMGHNGSGKSTTLKLLSGVIRPDGGWIRTQGRVAGLLEVGAGFHPDLTGRENVYLNAAILGMSKEETDARFDDIVEFAEIGRFIDTEVKRYSSGMYARLGFSVAVHTELDILLVDEVLSVGDADFRAKCNAKMAELQAQGKTMFIVSHSVGQVKKLCQRGIVLDHGRVVFDGPIEEALEAMKPEHKRSIKHEGLTYRRLEEDQVELRRVPETLAWPLLKLPHEIDGLPLVSIGETACAKTPLQSISIPAPVRSIGNGAFLNCTELTTVRLPSTLEEIEVGAFRGCDSLEDVVLPEGLKTIQTRAFLGCHRLRRLVFPRSLETVAVGAFADCPNLRFVCHEDSAAARIFSLRLPKHRIEIIPNSTTSEGIPEARQQVLYSSGSQQSPGTR